MYIIVHGHSAKELEVLVNEKIQEGYRPQGGVCIGQYGAHLQAMIK